MIPAPLFKHILDYFDVDGSIDFAMGYGSGIISQAGYDQKGYGTPMLDFIFATKDPIKWHQRNCQLNPHHYSLLMRPLMAIGPNREMLARKIQNWGAQIYYNNGIKMSGHVIKYGIISTEDLVSDLIKWNTLYVAGRMHKPHLVLKDNNKVNEAQQINLDYAFNVARSLLPCRFTLRNLLKTIIGISFMGDFRMKWGENPRKMENILNGQYENLISIYKGKIERKLFPYSPLKIDSLQIDNKEKRKICFVDGNVELEQDKREELSIPEGLAARIKMNKKGNMPLEEGIKSIVGPVSWKQAIKGIVTAGPLKSISYGMAKIVKSLG